MRTNGSIVKIWTLPLINEVNKDIKHQTEWDKFLWVSDLFVDKDFGGIVANRWDRVVVDVDFEYALNFVPNPSSGGNGGIRVTLWLNFGANGAVSDLALNNWDLYQTIAPRPIQISVE